MNLRTVYILSGILVVILGLVVYGLLSDTGEATAYVLPALNGKKPAATEEAVDAVVLETTRQLLDSRLRREQLLAELRRAWAELERGVGRRLDGPVTGIAPGSCPATLSLREEDPGR